MNRRHKKGSITAFGVVLALVLVVLGGGFLFFILFMGGQREVKNAVDSGMLNVGKQVEDADLVSVHLNGSPGQMCFLDVTTDTIDSSKMGDTKVDLRRINRVWGEAMLFCINAKAAGGDAGNGTSNASDAVQGAKDISDALANKLTNPNNLYGFFDDYTNSNSVRMLGNTVTTQHLGGANWKTSLMDRESESNIVLNGTNQPNFNLPGGFSLPSGSFTKSKRKNVPTEAGNYYFLSGYVPIEIAGNTFWQVPFQYDEKPHLVAKSTFDGDTKSAKSIDWDTPVPNAFSGEGEARKGNTGEKALTCVLTNPRQPFQLAIPHGFVKIHLEQMKAHWKFFPAPAPAVEISTSDYGYTTDSSMGPGVGPGILCTVNPESTELGLEVVGQSLDGVIFSQVPFPILSDGHKSELEADLVARCNEMITKPGMSVTADDVHKAMGWSSAGGAASSGAMISGLSTDFILYSPDGASLRCLPQDAAMAASPWLALLISNDPDGNEHQIADDDSMYMVVAGPPTVIPDPFCVEDFAFAWVTFDESLWWTPGTGYNSCLGKVRVKHWTDVYNLGVCTPVI